MSEKGCLKDIRLQHLDITRKCQVNQQFKMNNYKFPLNNGSPEQVLSTDGNGNLSWIEKKTAVAVYNTISDLPIEDNEGKLSYVKDINVIYLHKNDINTNKTGWYKIISLNENPTFTTGLESQYNVFNDAADFDLTVVAIDPEGSGITYSFSTNPSTQSIFTISQNSNVFTINPNNSAYTGDTITLTITASDGSKTTSISSVLTIHETLIGGGANQSGTPFHGAELINSNDIFLTTAANAFDNNTSNNNTWKIEGNTPNQILNANDKHIAQIKPHIGYEFSYNKTVTKYRLMLYNNNNAHSFAPTKWVFEYHNGSTYIALDTRNIGWVETNNPTSDNWNTNLAANKYKEFTIANPVSATKYRLRVTLAGDSFDTNVRIGELQLIGY